MRPIPSANIVKCLLGRILLACLLLLLLPLELPTSPLLESAFASDKPAKPKAAHSADKKKSTKKSPKKKAESVKDPEPVGAAEPIDDKIFDTELSKSTAIDAVLLIDSSRSMLRTDPQRLRNQGAKLFLRFLNEGDRLGIVQFDREAKTVIGLEPIQPADLTPLDRAIDEIPVEGAFTDLEAGIDAALKLLLEKGRPDAIKCVVLLSDGKMDPHPERGLPEELTTRVLEKDLPLFKERQIRLYTLALSAESDKELLAKFAAAVDGSSWYTPDAETIHLKFSDLFLTLKKPQVLPLEGSGFEVDAGVKEATFYITRKEAKQDISVIDPRGNSITSITLPSGVKWFKGQFFDIITITSPLPGRWNIRGLENPAGFATLLTDLKLQVVWPEQLLNAGDSVRFAARLSDGEKTFEAAEIADAIFYNFKVADLGAGAVISGGTLLDDGQNGDEKAGDRIFTGTIKVEKEGEYRALVAVTTPTFTRQQQIPFTVAGSAAKLELVESEGEAKSFSVMLEKRGLELKNLKVKLVAKLEGEKDGKSVALTKSEEDEGLYTAPVTELAKAGNYQIYATITGKGGKKQESYVSNSLQYIVDEAAVVAEVEGESSPWVLYLVAIVMSLGWSGGMAFFSIKRFGGVKTSLDKVIPYVVSEELTKRLAQLKSTASQNRRQPDESDREMLKCLFDDAGDGDVATPPAEAGVASAPAKEEGLTAGAPSAEVEAQVSPAELAPTEEIQPEQVLDGEVPAGSEAAPVTAPSTSEPTSVATSGGEAEVVKTESSE